MILGMHISHCSTLVGEKYTKADQILENNESVESIQEPITMREP